MPGARRQIDRPPGGMPPVSSPRFVRSRMTCQMRWIPPEDLGIGAEDAFIVALHRGDGLAGLRPWPGILAALARGWAPGRGDPSACRRPRRQFRLGRHRSRRRWNNRSAVKSRRPCASVAIRTMPLAWPGSAGRNRRSGRAPGPKASRVPQPRASGVSFRGWRPARSQRRRLHGFGQKARQTKDGGAVGGVPLPVNARLPCRLAHPMRAERLERAT